MAGHMDELIRRARDASQRFDNHARKPIVVEFAGCPKAGKTSTIGQIAAFFKRTGFKVEVVIERVTNEETAQSFAKQFRTLTIDTSAKPFRGNPRKTCETIADNILVWIEEHIAEDILFLPSDIVQAHFLATTAISNSNAEDLVKSFTTQGQFKPRNEVELNTQSVQALPVAIVRNQCGEVLRLRRKERDSKNPLHEKIVLWAGGHVRKEDAFNGDPLKQALIRELHEELRLDVDKNDLVLLGCVYTPSTEKSAQHLAVVYEWRAQTNDVAVSLSAAEFYERRGTSLSGTFVSIADLQQAVKSKEITESWSIEIVQKLLLETSGKQSKVLF